MKTQRQTRDKLEITRPPFPCRPVSIYRILLSLGPTKYILLYGDSALVIIDSRLGLLNLIGWHLHYIDYEANATLDGGSPMRSDIFI